MTAATIDPELVAAELASKLSAKARHVCAFLGAGAPRSAGLPDLIGLQNAVSESTELSETQRQQLNELFATRNLEEVLSYLRRLAAILGEGQSLGQFNATSATELHTALTKAIAPALAHTAADRAPFQHLASWASGDYYHLPIELFTINYDVLIETGFEDLGVPYFDGFVGTIAATFHPELVDSIDPAEERYRLPPNFVRLWKLHGSVNWEELSDGGRRRIVRRGAPVTKGAAAAIYPSDEKYDQSRRVSFVVLMDRFRRALAAPETFTLVTGYSFRDQHINEMMFDAARAHPRSELAVFVFGAMPDVLVTTATSSRNVSVYAGTEAIIAGRRHAWAHDGEVPGLWVNGEFQLVNFRHLTQFLATQSRLSETGA